MLYFAEKIVFVLILYLRHCTYTQTTHSINQR